MYFIRTYAIILLLAFASNLYAQITNGTIIQLQIDSALELKFNQIGERFCAEYSEIFKKSKSEMSKGHLGGMAICELAKVDTLNAFELKSLGFGVEQNILDSNCFEIFFVWTTLRDSVLEIKLGMPFESQFIRHEIKQNRVLTVFQEYYKNDKVVKLNKEDDFSNEIEVPIKVSNFLMNTTRFAPGESVYGFCEFETEPYFLEDTYLTPALHLKRTYRYFFNVSVL